MKTDPTLLLALVAIVYLATRQPSTSGGGSTSGSGSAPPPKKADASSTIDELIGVATSVWGAFKAAWEGSGASDDKGSGASDDKEGAIPYGVDTRTPELGDYSTDNGDFLVT